MAQARGLNANRYRLVTAGEAHCYLHLQTPCLPQVPHNSGHHPLAGLVWRTIKIEKPSLFLVYLVFEETLQGKELPRDLP